MSAIYQPKTNDQIFDALKRYLVANNSALNNFNTGSRLATILEGVSLVSSETQNDFYQGLLKAIPIAIYAGFNFARLPGIKASGYLVFSRSTAATQDYPIAIGTQIILNGIKFETIAVGSILNGATDSAPIATQCTIVGTQGNISMGAIDTLVGQGSFINQPAGVESCSNVTAFTNGTDEESDAARAQRFLLFINSLARSTVKGVLYAALSVEGIKSVSLVENLPDYGWITIYADDGTGTLPPDKQTLIEKIINGDQNDFANYPGYRAAGISLVVTAPTVHQINITGQLYILSSGQLTDAQYISLASSAIQTYTNSLKIGKQWILSEAITVAMNSHRDIYDFQVSTPTGNVSVLANEEAKTNSITIGVTRV